MLLFDDIKNNKRQPSLYRFDDYWFEPATFTLNGNNVHGFVIWERQGNGKFQTIGVMDSEEQIPEEDSDAQELLKTYNIIKKAYNIRLDDTDYSDFEGMQSEEYDWQY